MRFPPGLYSYQEELISSTAREVVCISATQIGKSTAYACWLLGKLWEHPGTRGWWAAPTYWQAEIGLDYVRSFLESMGLVAGRDFRIRYTPGRQAIYLPNGSIAEFRSWDNEKNLGGRAVHFLVIDEAGKLTQRARAELNARVSGTIRITCTRCLTPHQYGDTRYIGNPEVTGSVFWKICQDAIESEQDPKGNLIDGRARFLFKRITWEDQHRDLKQRDPEAAEIYRQWIAQKRKEDPLEAERLYDAEWAVPERAIFGRIMRAVFGTASEPTVLPSKDPHPGHTYITGWDIGIERDWTVGIPLCLNCWTITDMHRERPGDDTGIEHRIAEYARHWNNAAAVIETNGPGKPVFNRTCHAYAGGVVQAHVTTNASKREQVVAMLDRVDSGAGLRIADLPILKGEMQVFQSQQATSGLWTFSAPSGVHDDSVMATLIAIGSVTSGAAAYIEMLKRQLAAMKAKEQALREGKAA